MTTLRTAREIWHPHTEEDRRAVIHALDEVLTSPHFSNSKRYPALLRYVVESTLAGRGDQLKERTLGVEVFHRPPDYDTNTDTVVRYTAGEVRKRLSLYYHEQDDEAGIQIALPPGSYIPEFSQPVRESDDDSHLSLESLHGHQGFVSSAINDSPQTPPAPILVEETTEHSATLTPWRPSRVPIWLASVLAMLLVCIGTFVGYRSLRPQTAMELFWKPLLNEHVPTLISAGSVVFAPNRFSGVATAGKDTEYPFVSMQIAGAIGRLSGLLERDGAAYTIQPAASTNLSDLRERPIILLGGYNNEWSLRLLEPLRFHFSPDSDPTMDPSILDREHAEKRWSRDRSRGYSGADDYALVARYRNPTTDSMVVVLAGLGRNGTEAAAQFVTDPHFVQLLKDRLGKDLARKNLEVLLKISVVDGKTGAPSIAEIHTW